MVARTNTGFGFIAVGVWLGLTGHAHARGTISGWATPQYGGAFAGVGESGVQGIPYNPAASVPETFEAAVDVTGFLSDYSAQLLGKQAEFDAAFQGVPYFGAAMPVPKFERVGVGLSLGVPFARSAEDLASNSSQRFHALGGHVLVYELAASVGVEPVHGIELGGGLAFYRVKVGTKYAFNTGAALTEIIGPEMEPLIDDPLMEGLVETQGGEGQGFGGIVGARITAVDGWVFAGMYRSQTTVPIEAKVDLLPSNSFKLALVSDVTGDLVFPAEVHVMAAHEMGAVRLAIEGQWVGWSGVADAEFELVNPTLGSSDPVMELILSENGLTDLSALGQSQTDRHSGFVDTYGGGLRADIDAGAWSVMFRSYYSSRATPDAWVHPGSLDFQSLDNRAGVRRRFSGGVDLGFSFGWYFIPDRNIRDSAASYLTDPNNGPVLPSGNGDYHLNLWSTGLNLVVRLP